DGGQIAVVDLDEALLLQALDHLEERLPLVSRKLPHEGVDPAGRRLVAEPHTAVLDVALSLFGTYGGAAGLTIHPGWPPFPLSLSSRFPLSRSSRAGLLLARFLFLQGGNLLHQQVVQPEFVGHPAEIAGI